MKNIVLIASALAFSALCFSTNARAQQIKVEVDEIEVDLLPTPEFATSGSSKKVPKAKDWMEIEVEFKIEGKTEDGFVEELEFVYYVMMDDRKTLLVESVIHVNVPVEETMFSDIFISPTSLKKIFKDDVTSKSAVAGVAVEVKFRGGTVGGKSTVSGGRWWDGKEQTRGLLLKKSDTPFAVLWWDRYAELKKGS